ncbi:MAG: riboflavin synthase subunit beta [Flavobacteriaceae bacterium]|nr:riboflavin synthase subunit beta [Flavobacteriaceae bacterium]
MGFLKPLKRTYKKFDYKPRYYQGEGNPYEIKHRFDHFRTTTGENKNLKTKFLTAWEELKESRGKGVNKTIVIIALLLTLIFLFIIDFDLSIFLK